MKTYLVIIIMCFTACNRSMHKTATSSQVNVSSKETFVDNGLIKTTITTYKKAIYGDSLRGNISFSGVDTSPQLDSIESSGIKIKTKVTRKPGGGFNLNIEGVAKPKEAIENTTTAIDEKKAQATAATVNAGIETSDSNKDVKQNNSVMGFVAMLVFLALIVGAIILLVKRIKLL